jgi:ribosomal protein S24E
MGRVEWLCPNGTRKQAGKYGKRDNPLFERKELKVEVDSKIKKLLRLVKKLTVRRRTIIIPN